MIRALSYVVVTTADLPQWQTLATTLVGMHLDIVEPGRVARLRMDEKCQRIVLQSTDGPSSLALGFEVDDMAALRSVRDDLQRAGSETTVGTAAELALRGVTAMFHFVDPDARRVEVCCGLASTDAALRPGRPIGGFRTGELGIGHVALKAGRFAEMCALYRDVLHFKPSDHARVPFAVEFMHVNPRHHTVGIADTGTGAGVYHLMLEYRELDDLGRAHDMALELPDAIGVSLGRHLNDHVTSFYLRTPDGWLLELGWAARLIGDDWQVTELDGLSLWGHDRSWLPPAKREEARQLLRDLSARGVRAPVVLPQYAVGESTSSDSE